MRKVTTVPVPAIERLQSDAPDGPPFLGLMLDEATVRCLAEGVVNSRAEVAARKALAALDGKGAVAAQAS